MVCVEGISDILVTCDQTKIVVRLQQRRDVSFFQCTLQCNAQQLLEELFLFSRGKSFALNSIALKLTDILDRGQGTSLASHSFQQMSLS